MDVSREKDVIVFLETSERNREEINRGLCAEGNRIASCLGGKLSAMTAGDSSSDYTWCSGYGIATLYAVEIANLSGYKCDAYGWASKEALKNLTFRLLLFADTDRGRDLAPLAAFHLGTAAVTNCVNVRVAGQELFYVRSLYGNQLEQEVQFPAEGLEVATINIGALEEKETLPSGPFKLLKVPIAVPPLLAVPLPIETLPPDHRPSDILSARRIIGTGSGCADPELLSLAGELSKLLGGAMGTTRAVVDNGLMPRETMIGQTGKRVIPDLYLALGVSGSPRHVAGLGQSKRIISINCDPSAPIFDVSDRGFVGDLRTVLPKLIERIRQYRDEGKE